jgi:type IV pilus assembly protein PilW
MRSRLTHLSARRINAYGVTKREAGLTLVEIMVSLTLGLIVLLAVGSIYINSRQTYRVQEDNARIQEAGKYALEVIGRSIRQAGANAEITTNPVTVPVICTAPACTAIDNNGVAGATDTIRNQFYAGREELNAGAWITRDCTGGVVASGTLITNIFDLNGTDLRCTGSVGGAQALISDVEDLQVVYGIDTTGDQSADQYLAAPGNWAQVVTARVCVQVRSANNGLAESAQRFVNCAGALGTATGAAAFTTAGAGDRRLHRSFVGTFNLRNRINATP